MTRTPQQAGQHDAHEAMAVAAKAFHPAPKDQRYIDMFHFLNHKKMVAEFNRWRSFRHHPKKAAKRYGVEAMTSWNSNIADAPHDKRILICTDNDLYAVNWVKHPETGHEAWLVCADDTGAQMLIGTGLIRGWQDAPAPMERPLP